MAHDQPASADDEIGQEYVVSPALRRKLQKCYEHGMSLMAQEDYDHDYANTMFTDCVVADPANLVYVEAFLENLQRKYKNNKRGGRLLGFGGKGSLKKAVARQDWAEVLRQGPVLLKTNPWDVAVLRAMAQACEAFHFNEVELRYLKNALDANPKDADVNRHCALSLARMGQFDQAIACWHRVEEIKRHDPEAPKMISALSIEKARARAGFAPEESRAAAGGGRTSAGSPAAASAGKVPAASQGTTGKSPSAGPGVSVPQPEAEESAVATSVDEQAGAGRRREIELTPRQKLERALLEFPEDPENYLRLADLHLRENRPAEAEKVLTKALAVSGGDLKVRERLEDATAERFRHQLAIAEQRAEVKQTDEARQLAEQIRQNLARYELEVLQSRCLRYPQDASLKYQLGKRLKRLGNFAEAARQLQEADLDAGHRAAARLELGECLQQLKQYPKALLAYERAIDVADDPGQREVLKLALYRAGVLATALRQRESAQRHLENLHGLDPDFKDVRDRLDKLKKIGHDQ